MKPTHLEKLENLAKSRFNRYKTDAIHRNRKEGKRKKRSAGLDLKKVFG